MNFNDVKMQDDTYIAHTYARFPVAFCEGKGARLYDVEGKEYIDFGSGIGTNALGYGYGDWVSAVSAQAGKLSHCSNLYYNPVTSSLSEKLCKITGMKNVFFGNSGAEANECAIKTARKYSFDKYGRESERYNIISIKNSFHGRTVTTLAATGQDVFHNYFFPFTEGFLYSSPDMDEIKNLVESNGKVCAVIVEVIQGEGGVYPLKTEFLKALETYLKSRDILLIADEIQTGIGRTGKFLASMHAGIRPDIVTLAKGLAGGLPIGACLFGEKTEKTLSYSDHGSTFGGNLVSCAAANVVVDKVSDESFLASVSEKGEYLKNKLISVFGDKIKDIRGNGLMLGVEFVGNEAKNIASNGIKNGVAVLTAKSAVRFLPPLTITVEEIDEGVKRLAEVVE